MSEVTSIVERISTLDPSLDRRALCSLSADVRRLRAWVSSRDLAITAALAAVSPAVEGDVAAAQRVTQRHADRTARQAAVAAAVPGLADALAGGDVSVDHVEVLARAQRRLKAGLWDQLLAASDWLLGVASRGTAQDFDQAVTAEVRRLERRDGDTGDERLQRQKRATRLKTWTDQDTGMVHLRGAFDPEAGLRLTQALDAQLTALIAAGTPDTAPDDPFERRDHLRALALITLIEAKATGGTSRDTVVAVVDGTRVDADGNPDIRLPRGIELPDSVIDRMIAAARIHPVVVAGTTLIWAPGRLNLGRESRVANREQRRALRALHPTCMVPGCDVGFDFCEIHHVWWWEDGGPTDLWNLAPICTRHHHQIHDHGWHVLITPDRQLVVRLPDGTILATGPPEASAA